jgi:hypothetical protein
MEVTDSLDFLKLVRGLTKKMRELFDLAKTKAILAGEGKDEKTETMKDAEKAFKELAKETQDFERDIGNQITAAGGMLDGKL